MFSVPSSDTADFSAPVAGLRVARAGDIRVKLISGEDVLFRKQPARRVFPFQVSQLYATGTTGSLQSDTEVTLADAPAATTTTTRSPSSPTTTTAAPRAI